MRAEPVPTPDPTPLPSGSIEILTHCGLGFVRIEFEGVLWRFDAGNDPNPPAGWGFTTTVVELKPGPDGPIVIGPDGSEWPLISADPKESQGICL